MSPDELTGLLGRNEAMTELQVALALASRQLQPISLLYIDLDHLFQINETHGHLAGDAYIQLVGEAIQECFSNVGIAARVGGDEFIIVYPDSTEDQSLKLSENLRALISSRPLQVRQDSELITVPISVSIGIAHLAAGEASVTVDVFIRRSYEAVLRAKETGGNSVQIYSEAEERDGLTGTLKRAGLLAWLDQVCLVAEHQHSSVALITLDIDEFETINHQFGRYTGDEVLRKVANILHNNFKDPAIIGRFGGDEFVVILPGSRSETAFILAEEVRKVIDDTPIPLQIGDNKSQLNIHVSGGVAEYPSDGSDWREIFRKADDALYRAKRQGRNRICLPVSSQMVTKTSHFTHTQLEKLSELSGRTGKSEAYLLREGLDDLFTKYDI